MRLPWQLQQRSINSPRDIAGLAGWYDLKDAGARSMDTGVKLLFDKSGNSSTNVLCLNGVAGNYASAPDSAAVSVVGDIVLVGYIAPNDWTPAANQLIVSKYNSTSGNHRSYWLRHLTTGALNFNWSADGISATAVNSTATIGSADFAPIWVAAAFDVNNGAAGNDVRFYTSPDGVTWTQLGATVTTAGVASIFDGPATVNVGANDAGAFGNFIGLIYRTQIYSGIPAVFGGSGGALVFDANFALPAKLAPSFTESSSNAATVTINSTGDLGARIQGARDLYQFTTTKQPTISGGGALFDGTDDYMKAPAFALSQPTTVYFVGQQVTWTLSDFMTDGGSTSTLAILQSNVTPQFFLRASGSAAIQNGNLAVATNGIITAVFNGASSSSRVNRTTAVTGDPGANAANGFTLGSRGDGGASWSNILTLGVLVYSGAHDTATQSRVIQFLGRYYGIAV